MLDCGCDSISNGTSNTLPEGIRWRNSVGRVGLFSAGMRLSGMYYQSFFFFKSHGTIFALETIVFCIFLEYTEI
jgi:hypothetical protein